MDKVFDFREFILGFFKKFKLLLLLALIFAILGGAFGYVRFPKDDVYLSSSTATISTIDKSQDSTALSNAMIMLNAYVTSDSFYTELLNELSSTVDDALLEKLFGGDSTPTLPKVKEVLTITTRGNIVVVGVSAADADLPLQTSELCIGYIVDNAPNYNDALTAKKLGNEVVNITKQQNNSVFKNMLKFGILGFGGGVVLGLLLIFFVDVFDLRVKSASSLSRFHSMYIGDVHKASAIILNSIKSRENATLILTSSAGTVDVMPTAKVLKTEFEHMLKTVNIIKVDALKSQEEIDALTTKTGGINLVCCNCLLTSTDSLHYIGASDGVVLCEQTKISRTDNIDSAIKIVKNLGVPPLAIII